MNNFIFKAVQEPVVRDGRQFLGQGDEVMWLMYNQGDLAHPIACISDVDMLGAVKKWIALHPEYKL